MELTEGEIRSDIAGFEDKLREAEAGLASLPHTGGTWVERKRIKTQRSLLQRECDHINALIRIASEALAEA